MIATPSTGATSTEEEKLLDALAALTSTPAPFSSSGKRQGQEHEFTPQQRAQTLKQQVRPSLSPARLTPAPTQRPGVAATAHAAAPAPATSAAVRLDDEVVVLDAILGSLECQESTISGDLAEGDSNSRELTMPSASACAQQGSNEAEEDNVARVLARAAAVASSTLLASGAGPARKGDYTLTYHEHAALQRTLQRARPVLGSATCAALRPRTLHAAEGDGDAGGDTSAKTNTSRLQPKLTPSCAATAVQSGRVASLYLLLGTSLGAIVLYDARWMVLGVCGSAEPATVAQRGAVVSLSTSADALATDMTVAASHERGCYVLWDVETLAPLRVLDNEFSVPVLLTQHLFCDPYRTLTLDAAGCLKLLTYTRVLSKTMFRSSTLAQGPAGSAATAPRSRITAIADFDVVPHPSPHYLHNSDNAVHALDCGEVPVLLYTPAAAHSQEGREADVLVSPFVLPGHHLIVAVCSDTLALYTLQTGISNASAVVARRTHLPSSSLSNELVRFALAEQDSPRVLVCVSWNTEVELLRVVFDLKDSRPVRLESITVTPTLSPVQAMGTTAGASLVVLDQASNVLLLDVSVGVLVERYAMVALEPVCFTHRLCGVRYRGALAADRLSVVVLCRDRVFTCALLPWDARLRALLTRRRYTEALALVQDLAEEVALCAVGLRADAAPRRQALRRYMEAACLAYVRDTISSIRAGALSAGELHAVLSRIVSFCSRAGELEPVFFGKVMPHLRECNESGAAFLALERGMRQGLVTSMPEVYIKAFFSFFDGNPTALAVEDERGQFQGAAGASAVVGPAGLPPSADGRRRAEDALMHLETDLQCLGQLASENSLVRLRVTVLSLRLGRYDEALRIALTSPFTRSSSTDTATQSCYGRRVSVALDYFECTMRGASLLADSPLPAATRTDAKRQLWSTIVGDAQIFYSLLASPRRFLDTVLFAFGDDDSAFPLWSEAQLNLSLPLNLARVFCLLIGDATGDPNSALFTVAGAEKAFRPWQIAQRLAAQQEKREATLDNADSRDTTNRTGAHMQSRYVQTVHYFLNGLVELLCAQRCRLLCHSLAKTAPWQALCTVMVRHYAYMFDVSETPTERQSAQTQLNKLLRTVQCSAGHAGSAVRLDEFTAVFRNKSMARCLAAAYCRAGAYTAAIDCYTDRDNNRAEPNLANGVFALLRGEVARLEQRAVPEGRSAGSDGKRGGEDTHQEGRTAKCGQFHRRRTSSASAVHALRSAVMERVSVLVQVDATALAQFVFDCLPYDNDDVMRVLKSSSKTFLLYLDELLAKDDVAVANDVNLQNNYLELLCAHEPERVYGYLRDRDGSITYDVQVVLKAVRKHRIADASVLLLERIFMIDDAVDALISGLQDALATARAKVLNGAVAAQRPAVALSAEGAGAASSPQSPAPSEESDEDNASWAPVEHLLNVGAELIGEFQARARQATTPYWFRLLDTFVAPRRVLVAWLTELQTAQGRASSTDEKSASDAGTTTAGIDLGVFWLQRANELRVAASQAAGRDHSSDATASAPAPPLPAQSLSGVAHSASIFFVSAMIKRYTSFTSEVLRAMVRVIDPSTVVAKILQDNEDETFSAFKPIIADIMATIQFDLEVRRLCQTCVEEDLLELGGSLYRHLNSGVVPVADTCYLCGRVLGDRSQVPAHNSAVCIFACGHGFHEACRSAAAAAPLYDAAASDAVGGSQGCPRCRAGRAGAAREAHPRRPSNAGAAAAGIALRPVGCLSHEASDAAAERRAVLARRLRQTRAKIDGYEQRRSVLEGLLALSPSASQSTGGPSQALLSLWQRQGAGPHAVAGLGRGPSTTGLLRSPAPRLPVSLGEIGAQASPLDLTGESTLVMKLTDAEILELFGDG